MQAVEFDYEPNSFPPLGELTSATQPSTFRSTAITSEEATARTIISSTSNSTTSEKSFEMTSSSNQATNTCVLASQPEKQQENSLSEVVMAIAETTTNTLPQSAFNASTSVSHTNTTSQAQEEKNLDNEASQVSNEEHMIAASEISIYNRKSFAEIVKQVQVQKTRHSSCSEDPLNAEQQVPLKVEEKTD